MKTKTITVTEIVPANEIKDLSNKDLMQHYDNIKAYLRVVYMEVRVRNLSKNP